MAEADGRRTARGQTMTDDRGATGTAGADAARELSQAGYARLPGFVGPDRLERIRTDLSDALALAEGRHPDSVDPRDLSARYIALKDRSPEAKSRFYDVVRNLMSIHAAVVQPPAWDAIAAFFGCRALCVDKVFLRIDDQENDRLLKPHQEINQLGVQSVVIWFSLFDLTGPEDGGLQVYPGSRELGYLPHDANNRLGSYQVADTAGLGKAETMRTAAGEALLLHSPLVHASLPTGPGRVRWTVTARVSPVDRIPYLVGASDALRVPYEADYSAVEAALRAHSPGVPA